MSGTWKTKTPLDFLLSGAQTTPRAPAIKMANTELTYAEMLEEVEGWAGFFKDHNVTHGSRVAVYTDNNLFLTLAMFALWGIGAICMPMNVAQRPEKLREIEDRVTPDIGFYSADYSDQIQHPYSMHTLEGEKGRRISLTRPAPEEIAMIMFTSGTSGVPKGVAWYHGGMAHNNLATASRLDIQPHDRILINTPPYTTSSIVHVITMLSRGASIVVERNLFFGANVFEMVKHSECTGFGGVPVHFLRIRDSLQETDIPQTLRFLMNSGEHLPVPVIADIHRALPDVQIYCVYGITEGMGRFCILDPKKLNEKIGSVGVPIEGMEVSVRDENGTKLCPYEEGEVYAAGVCLMKGYLNESDTNRPSMTPDGFATGDYGYLDSEGFLFLRGRRDDIFKVGGEKVSLNMIEEAVFGYDDFLEFAVVPYESEFMGFSPCLYYIVKKGRIFDRRRLVKHLKGVLPESHIPTRFIEVTEIPRTGSGKVIRKDIRKD
ncbi:MAG: acyl--CoA ligase [Deltaproteobacteria bacterium]|nr:acyl--CoA ligase [Candidatus Zymogenaceae bacterium]